MILEWKRSRYERPATFITEENAHEYEHAEAEFGAFNLNACHNQRRFKDGTHEYMVYLFIPRASSAEWITLVRVRGHLLDAMKAAETALFGNAVFGPEEYRIPAESACIVGKNK